ncbi:type II toxin-antitoxin system HicA family toxin [Patescibacteria group bacterium]
MPKIPIIPARKLIKVLKKDGFLHDRTHGSHFIFYHPQKKIVVSVPVHKGKSLGRGITLAILKDAKIEVEEFLKLL